MLAELSKGGKAAAVIINIIFFLLTGLIQECIFTPYCGKSGGVKS